MSTFCASIYILLFIIADLIYGQCIIRRQDSSVVGLCLPRFTGDANNPGEIASFQFLCDNPGSNTSTITRKIYGGAICGLFAFNSGQESVYDCTNTDYLNDECEYALHEQYFQECNNMSSPRFATALDSKALGVCNNKNIYGCDSGGIYRDIFFDDECTNMQFSKAYFATPQDCNGNKPGAIWCNGTWYGRKNITFPTAEPTYSPTDDTISPSITPSITPSISPSITPTQETMVPSETPTVYTIMPTLSPTVNNSDSPSMTPSISPTKSNSPTIVTVNPTQSPTVEPTVSPTNVTMAPTEVGLNSSRVNGYKIRYIFVFVIYILIYNIQYFLGFIS